MDVKNFLKLIFLMIPGSLSLLAGTADSAMHFDQGLALRMPHSPYAAFRPDPIEAALVSGTWQAPEAGTALVIADTTLYWQTIEVDSTGWFNDSSLRGGYVFLSVHFDRDTILLLEEYGNDFVYVNGEPRIGNRYGFKDHWESWEPRFNYSLIPVALKKGDNEFLFYLTRTGRLKAKLQPVKSIISFNSNDMTLPDILVGEAGANHAAVVLSNNSRETVQGYTIQSQIGENEPVRTPLPSIPALTIRKVGFELRGWPLPETGDVPLRLKLFSPNGEPVDSSHVLIRVKHPLETHRRTFTSEIDGSVQYYAVNPARDVQTDKPKALILSTHGAAVEAINQANAYYPKTWAHIVAPTNRRPYGFNWEDWGRMDAMEVLQLVKTALNIDPDRIYLTGHSMGGHGAWHLGATFPDQFAAIGPSAGWLSFWSYRVREAMAGDSDMHRMLDRLNAPSHTLALAENYRQLGVYIIHGAEDDNVPAEQSRQMVRRLQSFHKDFIYHEEPGQGHWWDLSDEPGADCVDWPPLFDFFARHARPGKERLRRIEFITANPGISAQNYWLTIEAQEKQLDFSRADIRFDPGTRRFHGTTQNITRLSLDVGIVSGKDPIRIDLDGQKMEAIEMPADGQRLWLEKRKQGWTVINPPAAKLKGPHRYGTFKDAFRNRFMLIYGTAGTAEENAWAMAKARYDAEQFWYQGNGSVDMLPDSVFNPQAEPDRNIILYGNAQTNRAWPALLADSPVQVHRGQITMGAERLQGDDLACLFIRPRPGSASASMGVVSGTGLTGMRLTNQRPYLSPGYGFADLTIMTPEILRDPLQGIRAVGFFGPDWSLESAEVVWNPGHR